MAKPASFGAGFVLGVHENCPGRVGESSRLKPLLQGVEALAVAFDLAIRGPSEAAEPADQTRRAPHMDVRRFPRRQDASSENPAGSANPMRSIEIGRAAGWERGC